MSDKTSIRLHKGKKELRERSIEIDIYDETVKETAGKIVAEMTNYLKSHKNLAALSAKQLGYTERIFCIKFSDGDVREFINPLIYHGEGSHLSREVQIGVSSKEYIIPRYDNTYLAYMTLEGKDETNLFKKYVGEIVQQMVDLLDGVLLEDFGLEILEGFDEASDEEKADIIGIYVEMLRKIQKDIDLKFEEDDNLKMADRAVEFLKQKSLGKIEEWVPTEDELKQIREAEEKRREKSA